MASKTGGAAFPMIGSVAHNSDWDIDYGMTLRDYFAGQALNQATREIWAEHKMEVVAKRAYEFADAMIAARDA